MKTPPQNKHTHNRRDFLKIAGASALAAGLATAPEAGAAESKIKGFSCIPLNFGRQIAYERTMSYEDWMRMAVEFGLDATEIYDPYISGLNALGKGRLAEFMRNLGLKASMYTIESNLCDPKDREETLAHIRDCVDNASIFGANIVRVVSGHGSQGRDHEDVLQSIADGLRAGLDYAEEKEMTLAYEDHWEVGTNMKDFLRILELVDDDRLKVNLDTANVGTKDIVELTRRVKDRVVHTHISELKNDRHGAIIGRGDVDIRGVFTVLKNNGYDGWISLEPLSGGKEDLRFSVDHVKKEWELA